MAPIRPVNLSLKKEQWGTGAYNHLYSLSVGCGAFPAIGSNRSVTAAASQTGLTLEILQDLEIPRTLELIQTLADGKGGTVTSVQPG